MRKLILLVFLLCLPTASWAGYLNFNAAQMEPDSAAGATRGVCTAGTSPACTNATHSYFTFSGTADNYTWISTTVPQDAPAAPFMRCGFSTWQATASATAFSFKFSFQAFNDTADATPASVGNTTAVVTQTASGTNETINLTGPGGTAVAILNAVTGVACASSACSGKDLIIRVQRAATDGSDVNAQTINLKTIACEVCGNSGCS